MTTILLIRHAVNDWVKTGKLAGWTPGEPYLVSDVSHFAMWLNPPPADPSVRHLPREE